MVDINLKIEKKDLWLLSAIAIFLVGTAYVIAYGGNQPNIMGHSAGEVEGALPAGAVIAFNLTSCPAGWTELVSARGKVIVGLNVSDSSFNALGKIGGEKTHILTISELPSHTHSEKGTVSDDYNIGIMDFGGQVLGTVSTGSTGGNVAHNNLQPYITLIYCQKN
jgi:hypothetical protein